MGLLYTKLKVFHFKDKIDSLPPHAAQTMPPIHVRIKPTNICNHNCRYCAYRVENLQLGQNMDRRDSIPRHKMIEIIQDLASMGVEAVTFSGGGDPLCYPHLLEAASSLSQTRVKFAALTNGSRLHGRLAEAFAFNATWLRISMDGWDDESYSYYRGVPNGEFSKILGNMEDFKRLGGSCYLGVSLIVDQHNASHLYDSIQRLKDIGVDSVKVSPCIVSNLGAENNRYHRFIFDEVKKHVERAKEDLENETYEIFDSYHELDEKFTKDYPWCPYLQILPVIGADLKVYSCQDKAYNLAEGVVGSLENSRFKDFWFSGQSKFFRINPSIDCNHHCVANEKNRLIIEYLGADGKHIGFV